MTTALDPAAVPPGWIGIRAQQRALPVDKILYVQGNLTGGTEVHLMGGTLVQLEVDVNSVLAAIDEATWGPGIPVTVDDALPEPDLAPTTVDA